MRNRMILLLAMLTLFIAFSLSGCGLSDPAAVVSIDGNEFLLDATVRDITDAGFALSLGSKVLSKVDYPEIEARIMAEDAFNILTDDLESTHVFIRVYNPDNKAANLMDCKVYEYVLDYDAYSYYDGKGVDVTLNGIDFEFKDCAETAEKLGEAGFKFDKADVEAFCENDKYGKSIISAKGLHGMHLSIAHDYDYHKEVVRVNKFDLTKKLKFKIVQ
ncbi:MAG: hypothetical protein IJ608_12125 [Lachnospiraceae bacterium]|nr:hypothetical protein [Lachnospiraceae bacterium]